MSDKKEINQAVALRYQEFEPAPKVIAKGEGLVAEKIIEKAKECGIFVHDSPELVALLSQLEIDDYLPQTLWVVVAELLQWVSALENDTGIYKEKQ